MAFAEEMDVCIRSRSTLICVTSFEEERILSELKAVCQRLKRELWVWDCADFFRPVIPGSSAPPAARDPLSALDAIEKAEGDALYVLLDFHQCWEGQPRVVRKLRNLAWRLKYTKKSIVVTLPHCRIPQELRDDAVLIEFKLPDASGLDAVLTHLASAPNVKVNMTPEGRECLIRAGLGLSSNQAQRAFAKGIVSNGVLDERDIDLVISEKKEVIRESGALEFFSPVETLNDVGGLEVLKGWLRMRERAFGQEARDYGLPQPKGIALIGIPGTGKSLTAKTIAGLWHHPLIRLDVGALFGSLVGQSEENTRRALSLAEAVSPCILWIDEIEKGLAVGLGDGGTSMRVFSSILTWMQEKTKPVFVVATANNIAMIPPELLRRGRFDEVFFLDLPTLNERREIFAVHIRKRKRPVERFDLGRLAQASEGYVGAEIEQAIIDAMVVAFNDRGREFTNEDVLCALIRLVPLSRSQREVVEDLRLWLSEGRAQSASFQEAQEAKAEFVQIQLDPQGLRGDHGVLPS